MCPMDEDSATMLNCRLITRATLFRIAGACLTLIIMMLICRDNYVYCKTKEASYIRIGTHIELSVNRLNSEEVYELYGPTIEYYREMQWKYHYAAWNPLLTLMPDPPHPPEPKWPSENP
jgi:hypothetical protein